MENMRKFEKPEMEVIVFEAEDIIITSTNEQEDITKASEGEFMMENMDGDGYDNTEPTVPTTSEGTAEAANSANQSDALEEVVEDEPVIEEPVMTEEVVEEIVE